jgi:hypothetical protein
VECWSETVIVLESNGYSARDQRLQFQRVTDIEFESKDTDVVLKSTGYRATEQRLQCLRVTKS